MRRTSSRTSPPSTSASRSATTASTSSCATPSACSTSGRSTIPIRRCARLIAARRRSRAHVLRAASRMARHMRAGAGEERLRIGPDWFGDIIDDGLGAGERARAVSKAAMTLAGGGPAGSRVDRPTKTPRRIGAARRRAARPACGSCSRPSDPSFVYFLETRGPRRVPARRADRRVGHHPRAADRPDAGDGADLGHADGRRVVRLRARPARRSTHAADVRVPSEFDFTEQAILYLPRQMPPPKSPEFGDAVGARGAGPADADRAAARSCCSPATPCCARCMQLIEFDAAVSAARAGHRAAQRAAAASSARRPTPCCWRPRRSGRAWTWWASS